MNQYYELDVGSLTDVGRIRELNEDSLGTFEMMSAALAVPKETVARKGRLYAVADGMGGHAAGEVASRHAINVLFQSYYEDTDIDLIRSLERAFWAANSEIYAQSATNAAQSGMGTTLVAAVIQDNRCIIANVGDSRAYLVRGGQIEQITHDHSWVGEQVEAGLLTESEAQTHMYRNIITRSMGNHPDVDVDTFSLSLNVGDYVVLCTDGLSSEVQPNEIARVIMERGEAQAAAAGLVNLANKRGGDDNVTVLIIKVVSEPVRNTALSGNLIRGLAALAVIGLLAFCVLTGPLAGLIAPRFFQGQDPATSTAQPPPLIVIPVTTDTDTPSPAPPVIPATPTATPVYTPTPTGPPTSTPGSIRLADIPHLPTALPVFGWKIVPPTPGP